jgi:hypothetical protein
LVAGLERWKQVKLQARSKKQLAAEFAQVNEAFGCFFVVRDAPRHMVAELTTVLQYETRVIMGSCGSLSTCQS